MARPIRVLHTTDSFETDETVLTTLEDESAGISVSRAPPDEALDRLDIETFDCVVVTQTETWRQGVETVERIRGAYPGLPVLLATGTDEAISGLLRSVDGGVTEQVRTAVDGSRDTATREQVEMLSETFPDIAFYIDERGRYTDVLAGTDSPVVPDDTEQFVGSRVGDLLSPEVTDRVRRTIDRALESEEIQSIQYEVQRDGHSRWLEARVSPVGEGDDGVRQVLWVARDITAQKQHEAALEALHEMATTIQTAETVEEACELTLTAAADVLEFEICSVSIKEGEWLVPYALSEDAQPEGGQRRPVDQGLAGQTFQTGESYIVDQVSPGDETDPAFDSIESGLSVPVGEYGVFQAVSTEPGTFDDSDITLVELLVSHTTTAIERIEREEALTRKTERLEQFASFVSHDLRNPLNVANLRLELLAEETDSNHVDGLAGALDRMERLIDELLTLARQGETIGETEPVQLASVVRQAWSNVETSTATLVCPADLTLQADRNRLTAVLENLVGNAVEHGGADVTVTVDVLDDEPGFYVADDGSGLPADTERLFESGYSTAANGTGFGLRIVKDIVEAHGWRVQVTESESGGARVEISGVEG